MRRSARAKIGVVIPCSDTHGARADGKRFVFVSLAKFLSSILNKNTGGDQLHRPTERTPRMRE
jgi:hypothetical protein